jgi:hypothetical protein
MGSGNTLDSCLYVIIRVLWAKLVSATEIDSAVRRGAGCQQTAQRVPKWPD